MTVVEPTKLNETLLDELREMARGGKTCEELVRHVREALRLPADNMVPVLAYLCRAFSIPLSLALPLREDEGKGAFGRAISIAIWFSALVGGEAASRLDWERFYREFKDPLVFDGMEEVAIEKGAARTRPWLRRIVLPGGPWYLEGAFEAFVVKSMDLDRGLFDEVQRFANAYRREVAKNNLASPLQAKIEFKIEDRGPNFLVTCMVRAFRGQVEATK